jgi:hypothetical protein
MCGFADAGTPIAFSECALGALWPSAAPCAHSKLAAVKTMRVVRDLIIATDSFCEARLVPTDSILSVSVEGPWLSRKSGNPRFVGP